MMSQRDKRAVLIVAAAAALFAALEFGVLPLWDTMQAEREGLEVREQTFLKFREAVASRAEREAAKALLESRLREAEAGLLPGETPAIASAELRTRVQQLAAAHGMEVPSIQFLPERPLGEEYVQVPLGIQLKGRIDGLVGFLQDCGTGPTTLRVLVLNVQGASDPEKILTVGVTVAGILRK
jgi:Tfp pilus assembly protein PilO